MPRLRTPKHQGGTSRARTAGPSRRDHHIPSGRDAKMVQLSCRSSPDEDRRQSNKGKQWHISPQRSQLARPAEQQGKSSKRIATPEPTTAQVSQRATDQAQCVLQLIEAGAHSREQSAGSGTFLISMAAILRLLTDEFSNDNPEDGRYATQQCRQDAEISPATTGEFNRMLKAAVHEVRQPRGDEETSSSYARCRAAQERLSQRVLTLPERVKTEPDGPLLVDSTFAHTQWWQKEFHNHVALQRYRNADLQAAGTSWLPDQNIVFDQNGIPRDRNNFQLRHDLTHEPSELGSSPLEYRDGPDGGDGDGGSDPSSHDDN
jgi:hypothetical protein